jgi:hypothetical protein
MNTGGFRFASLRAFDDVDFYPGAVKYGDVPALIALAACSGQQVFVAGEDKLPAILDRAPNRTIFRGPEGSQNRAAVDWLLEK